MKSRWQAVIMAGALLLGQIVFMGMPPSVSALTCQPGSPCFGNLLFAPRGTLGGEYWNTLKVGGDDVATTWSESEVDLSIYNFSNVVGTMLNFNLTQPIPIDVLYQNTGSTLAISFVPPDGYKAQVGDVLSLSIAASSTFMSSLTNPEVGSVQMGLEIGGVQFVVISNVDNGVGDVNNVVGLLGVAPAPVPEPATMILFGTGLAGLVAFGRRRRK